MSTQLRCDFCGEQIFDDNKKHNIELDRTMTLSGNVCIAFDICDSCYKSPVILSEMRCTRTRKPAIKTGPTAWQWDEVV
jgi:hypothetical protein